MLKINLPSYLEGQCLFFQTFWKTPLERTITQSPECRVLHPPLETGGLISACIIKALARHPHLHSPSQTIGAKFKARARRTIQPKPPTPRWFVHSRCWKSFILVIRKVGKILIQKGINFFFFVLPGWQNNRGTSPLGNIQEGCWVFLFSDVVELPWVLSTGYLRA